MTKPQKLVWGIGGASLATGIGAWQIGSPAISLLLAWTSLSCAGATLAYATNRPGWYGKRRGKLVWWRAAPSAVFLLAFRIACGCMRLVRKHPPRSRINPWLWVAGRLNESQVPEGVDYVVDLVAEFPEPQSMRERSGYRFLGVLDGHTPPDQDAVLELLDELATPGSKVLVHCDSGMGRAPSLAALLLLRRGATADLPEAITTIQRARPFIHLGRAEMDFLEQIAPRVPLGSPPSG